MAVQNRRRHGSAVLALGVLGAFSQLAQALLARELLVAFYGNEISLGAFYGAWLGWIALGAALVGRGRKLGRPVGAGALRRCMWLLPVALVAQITLVRAAHALVGVAGGEIVGLGTLLGVTALVTAPSGLLAGMAFVLACRGLAASERDAPAPPRGRGGPASRSGGALVVSLLYTVEAAGALLGGLLFTVVLLAGIGPLRTVCIGAFAAATASYRLSPRWPARLVPVALGLAAVLLGLTPAGESLERYGERLRFEQLHPGLRLLDAFDTRYGHVAVARLGAQRSVFLDGRVANSYPDPHGVAQRAAYFEAQSGGARRVLLIGSVASGLASELLRYPIERLDAVEQDRRAFERLRPQLDAVTGAVLRDQRAHLHFEDGRYFVSRRARAGHRGEPLWDLVLLDVPDPASAQLNRFYTVEIYRQLRAQMSRDGVLCTAVTGASGYLGREVSGYSGSVYRTLTAVFSHVVVAPGERHTFCASNGAGRLSESAERLADRYRALDVTGRSFPASAFATLLPPERVAALHRVLERGGGELNRDARPVSYFLNMVLWTRLSSPALVGALYALRRMGIATWLTPLFALVLLLALRGALEGRARQESLRSAGTLAIACTGLVAMACQLTLLFAYQARVGVVFERIALLNGLFMTGLALGAGLVGRRLARGRAPGRSLLGVLVLIAAGCALLPDLLTGLRVLDGAALETGFSLAVCLAGTLAGAVFPLGVGLTHGAEGDVGRTAGVAEAADHLGGAVGGLLAGAVWVPLLGVAGTSRLLAWVALSPLVVLAVALSPAERRGRLGSLLAARGYRSFPFVRLSWALGWLVIVTAVITVLARGATGPQVHFRTTELAAVSDSGRFELRERPMPHYLGGGGATAPQRTVSLASMPVASGVRGYAGPLNLLVSLDERGVLRGVRYLSSDETPAYIYGIDDWLKKLQGRDLSAAALSADNVDVISGASISSRAALETINRAARLGAATAFDLHLPSTQAGGRAQPPPWRRTKVWAVLLLLALAVPAFLSGREWPRLAYQVAALGVLGLWLNVLLTEVDIANLSLGRLPALASNPVWYLLVGFAAVTSLLWGQVYCGFVCPFGTLQELLSRLGRLLGLRAYAGRYLEMRMRYAKYLLLAASLLAFWISGEVVWMAFNPMQHLFGLHLGGWMGLLIAASLIGALRYYRFWCRYFCPLGALLALGNKLALWRSPAPQRSFAHCDLGVRDELDVDCIQCNRCITRVDLGVRPRRR